MDKHDYVLLRGQIEEGTIEKALVCDQEPCRQVVSNIKMNKLLIVLLAVCLVSVHAFVKRDTEAKQPDTLSNIQKEIEEFANTAKDKLSEAFDPEKLKQGFNDFVDTIHKAVSPKNEGAKQ